MAVSKIELQQVDIDFSNAIVEKATASILDLELKLSGVKIPDRRSTRVLLRFEAIKDFDSIWYRLNTKVRKTRRTEFHDPWPLKLPAKLKTLAEVKCRGQLRRFHFAVAEEHFKGRKHPLELNCKRLCITDLKGKLLAGDPSTISTARKWSKKDARKIADEFAQALEAQDFLRAHSLCCSKLAKAKSVADMAQRFQKRMRRKKLLKGVLDEPQIGSDFKHLYIEGYDPDLVPKSVDADRVVHVVATVFPGWFVVNLVLAEEEGRLAILHYSLNSDWEVAF